MVTVAAHNRTHGMVCESEFVPKQACVQGGLILRRCDAEPMWWHVEKNSLSFLLFGCHCHTLQVDTVAEVILLAITN